MTLIDFFAGFNCFFIILLRVLKILKFFQIFQYLLLIANFFKKKQAYCHLTSSTCRNFGHKTIVGDFAIWRFGILFRFSTLNNQSQLNLSSGKITREESIT